MCLCDTLILAPSSRKVVAMASSLSAVALSVKPCLSPRQGFIPAPSPSSSSLAPCLRSHSISASRRTLLLLLPAASKRSSPSQRIRRERNLIEEQRLENEDVDEDEEEYVRPVLPGDEPDFWEGPQWNALGFIVQYLWAIGIVVALTGCFIAVRYYNEGASDFKETEVFKEAMEAQGFVESPSDSTIFDEPEPKDAPSPSQ